MRINSQSFSKKENEILQRILKAKLGIKTTLNKDKKWFRLRVADKSMKKLKKNGSTLLYSQYALQTIPVTTVMVEVTQTRNLPQYVVILKRIKI